MLSRSTANDELHEWNVTLAVGRVASLMKHTWRTTVCGVAGTWRFTAAGKGKPALVFTPAEAGGSSQRVLAAVDAQLDDGQVAAGKFRSDGQAGVLTLRDE